MPVFTPSREEFNQLQNLVDSLLDSPKAHVSEKHNLIIDRINHIIQQHHSNNGSHFDNSALLFSYDNGLFVLDTGATILSVNEVAAKRFNSPVDKIIGQKIFRFFDKKSAEIRELFFKKAIESGQVVSWHDTRKSLSLYNMLFPIKDNRGRVYRVAAIAKDTTTPKNYKKELIEKEQLLATALDINNSFVWEVNLESRMLNMYNYQPQIEGFEDYEQTMTVEDSRTITHPEDRLIVEKAVNDHYLGKTDEIVYEVRILYSDGEYYWHAAKGKVVEKRNGKPYRILGLSTNINDYKIAEEEKKKLEDQLYHSQKMEAIGRLAGGISHDFNNLLTAIIGQAELALLNISPDQPLYNDLNNILDASQKAATLAKQLLTISRKQKHNPKSLDVNDAIKNIQPLLKRIIGEKVQIILGLDSALPPVFIDPSQLDQITVNLIVNARDAIRDTGKIYIKTEIKDISESFILNNLEALKGQYVRLSITDTGSGIPKGVQQKIFEPFFTTKPEGKGTGLGLATVYGIVKQNKGFIHLYSEVDAGTTFKIYFPVSEKSRKIQSQKEESVGPPSGDETVLVLEDDDAVRTLTIATLDKFGYKTLDARTSKEAQIIIDKYNHAVDLVIADVFLPDINGPEFIQNNMEKLDNTKVMYISGYTREFIRDQHPFLNKIHFLGKPFRPVELLTTVRKILDS